VVTPPNTHCRIFLDALNAGKHVLIEKPVCIKKDELAKMVKSAAAHPRLVTLEASCRHARLQPKFQFVKHLVDSGRLGQVYHIHHATVNRQGRPGLEFNPGAYWFLNKAQAGGGPSFDWGVYDLSFHLGIMGDKPQLKKVCTMTKNGLDARGRAIKMFDVEEHLSTFMTFDNGLTYAWERSTNAHNKVPNMTRIYGTKGGLSLSFVSWDPPQATLYDIDKAGKARETVLAIPMKGHNDDNRPLIHHFLDCLDKKAKPHMPVKLAAKHIDIIMRVLEAAK
jgi:predicted dehydrogenase